MNVIITKHSFTSGPSLVSGEVHEDHPMCFTEKHETMNNYYWSKDWHATKRDACDNVLDRYAKEKLRLKKQLGRLDKKLDMALKSIESMEIP
jgi:hypothetical protein